MRAAAALRRGGGRGDDVAGYVSACAGAEAGEDCVCATIAQAGGRAVWGESQSAVSAYAVAGRAEAATGEYSGDVSRVAGSDRDRSKRARHQIRRGQLGVAGGRRVGRGLAGDARWAGDYAVHLLSAVRGDGSRPD